MPYVSRPEAGHDRDKVGHAKNAGQGDSSAVTAVSCCSCSSYIVYRLSQKCPRLGQLGRLVADGGWFYVQLSAYDH